MTQPANSPIWLQEILDRYRRGPHTVKQPRVRPEPIGFDFEREPFDPSSYYRDIGTLRQIGQAGTEQLNTRLANQREKERQAFLNSVRMAGTRTASAAPSFSNTGKLGNMSAPLKNFRVTSGFGRRSRPTAGATSNHMGADLAAPAGTPIYATHNGIVSSSGWSDGYGWNITLNAGGGVESFYGHNSRNVVKPGQRVRRGQLIGYVGSTGVSTGPHLHYGLRVNGRWVNPL